MLVGKIKWCLFIGLFSAGHRLNLAYSSISLMSMNQTGPTADVRPKIWGRWRTKNRHEGDFC
jgi:hypothetical protein